MSGNHVGETIENTRGVNGPGREVVASFRLLAIEIILKLARELSQVMP